MSYDRPLPQQTREGKRFWEAATEERLEIQKCDSCRRYVFHPRFVCPYCLSDKLAWEEVTGEGAVYSFSVIHHPPTDAWKDQLPYAVGVVRLEPEDVHLFTQFKNVDVDDTRVGLPVEVTFDHVTDDVTLPKFQPREE